MARSPHYWYDFMIAQKNSMSSLSSYQPNIDSSQTLLNDVTTTSKVARWRLYIWCVAVAAYSIDTIFDLALMSFELLSKKSRFGTLPWYVNQSLSFQYGDTLVYQNNEWQYATINTINQIVKRVAPQENGNTVNLKVAKLVSNVPTKLNSTELASFTAYIKKIKPAGVNVNIISDDPDDIILYIKAIFDPLLLDDTGQLLSSPGTYPLNDAVNQFLSNLNDNFTGTVDLCELIDAIQLAQGIKSAYMIQASARYGTNAFSVFTERYESNAGHLVISSVNPLSSTVTYQSSNV